MDNLFFQTVIMAIGVVAFSMRFNEHGMKILYATILGMICWFINALMDKAGFSAYASCFVAIGVLTMLSEILARIVKTPVSVLLAPALIPMIPGESLYVAMNNMMNGNTEVFKDKSVYTLFYSACIAAGVVSATVVSRLVITGIKNVKKYV